MYKNIFKYRLAFSLIVINLHTFILQAQPFFPEKKYPIDSYQIPIEFAVSLAGNFGECRPNHFHSGIDIRTNQTENHPIHALADGFVSRIKIEAGGFGNAIYITQTDGYTSLYAHLNSFFPELEAYTRSRQYDTKSWKQDIYLMPHQFPIRKGDIIALSGNTGSSQGPHLHLEIRNSKTENPLNPLLFFNSLTDTQIPIIKYLAMYDGQKSVYEQKPILTDVIKTKKGYALKKLTLTIPSDKVFFGIAADDYMEEALGTLGVYEMHMYVNDQPFFAWQLDNISYDITRYMNAMADFKTKKNNGPWIQLCRQLPNDKLNIYKSFTSSDGLIDLTDGLRKKIRIEVFDTKRNTSAIEFWVQGQKRKLISNPKNNFVAGKKNNFSNQYIEFNLKEDALYDDINFVSKTSEIDDEYSQLYEVHEAYVPVHSYFDLKLKPKQTIPAQFKEKMAMLRLPYTKEGSSNAKAARCKGAWVIANVRDFGTYKLVVDTVAPNIQSTINDNDTITSMKTITFTIQDNYTSIAKCEALVDGKWLRLVQKGDTFYYEMDEHFPIGKHQFDIVATDENKNTRRLKYTLIK
ncbi:MAG: M23 family metallopeptidase [Bacteroidetes bacterium]|nr:M23 family metallopeptidase [Bacteroidota bacterium]